jgi:hybrid cluster-associated redox disulfide protein
MEKKQADKKEKPEENKGITSDMNIGEIVNTHPETAPVFFSHGIHCFGCMAAHFESLEEGLMAHGMTNEEIDNFLEKLNEEIKEAKSKNP